MTIVNGNPVRQSGGTYVIHRDEDGNACFTFFAFGDEVAALRYTNNLSARGVLWSLREVR